MRVLMFGWEFPPHNSGGLGVACAGLTRALAARGVEVIFVLPRTVPVEAPFLSFAFADTSPVKVEKVDTLLAPYIGSEEYRVLREGRKSDIYGRTIFEEVRRYARRAREIAAREWFNVIHAHDWLSFPAGIAAKEASGKPLVVHVHATEFDRGGRQKVNDHVYRVEKEGMERADHIIAVSHLTRDILSREYGINPEKVTVVHNGVDAGEHSLHYAGMPLDELRERGKKIVLFLGRLTIQKGPDYFVRAAKIVAEHVPEAVFVIAGSGDMEHQVVEEVARERLSDRVLFAGFVRGPDREELYRAADVFVMPSVSEPFGITPLESLLNGTPVIISKQSGVSEVLRNALVVDFWDVDELANKIIAVLHYDSLRGHLSKEGARETAAQTWEKAAARCAATYEKVCERADCRITVPARSYTRR